jgi:hypothetical protein
VITALVINFRYAPGRKEMDKEKGKRKLQEPVNEKSKEKSQPGGSLYFGLKPARMADC